MPFEKDTLLNFISNKIKGFRDKKFTQEQLAKAAKMSRPTLISYENAEQSISVLNLYLIAEALGIEAKELLPSHEELKELSSPEKALKKEKKLSKEEMSEVKDFLKDL